MDFFRRLIFLSIGLASLAVRSETSEDMKRDFARARGLFDAGQESAAKVSFVDFLRRYPKTEWADDAQFYLGEIEFRQRHFDDALNEFRKVYSYREQRADRIADSFVRAGDCLERLGRADQARIEWEAVKRVFPKTRAAADADERLLSAQARSSESEAS